MSDELILKMENLQIEGFQEEQWRGIVNGIDLELRRGQVIGLIGESGAGKSTIGIASMGFCRPGCRIVDGSIKFDGMELTTMTDENIRALRGVRISYVAQSAAASFNPAHRLIGQYSETPVQHGVLPTNEAEKNAREIYRRLDLPDPDNIGNRYPHQVSGGQLQRCMVAMAMACNPKLLIADEPTTALDVTIQAQILEIMQSICQEFGAALIIITHNLGVVARYADNINVMYAGKIIEQGTAKEIFENPRHPYTMGLLNSVPRLDEPRKTKLEPIEGLPPDLINLPPGCSFRARCKFSAEKCSTDIPHLETVPGERHVSACWEIANLPKAGVSARKK